MQAGGAPCTSAIMWPAGCRRLSSGSRPQSDQHQARCRRSRALRPARLPSPAARAAEGQTVFDTAAAAGTDWRGLIQTSALGRRPASPATVLKPFYRLGFPLKFPSETEDPTSKGLPRVCEPKGTWKALLGKPRLNRLKAVLPSCDRGMRVYASAVCAVCHRCGAVRWSSI